VPVQSSATAGKSQSTPAIEPASVRTGHGDAEQSCCCCHWPQYRRRHADVTVPLSCSGWRRRPVASLSPVLICGSQQQRQRQLMLSRCTLRTLQHLPRPDTRYVAWFGAVEVFFLFLTLSLPLPASHVNTVDVVARLTFVHYVTVVSLFLSIRTSSNLCFDKHYLIHRIA